MWVDEVALPNLLPFLCVFSLVKEPFKEWSRFYSPHARRYPHSWERPSSSFLGCPKTGFHERSGYKEEGLPLARLTTPIFRRPPQLVQVINFEAVLLHQQ